MERPKPQFEISIDGFLVELVERPGKSFGNLDHAFATAIGTRTRRATKGIVLLVALTANAVVKQIIAELRNCGLQAANAVVKQRIASPVGECRSYNTWGT